ncbi:MAG TPA: hypothetical protein VGC76_00580 [Pyrinomonadaceae bacterium]|jgi:hypothetical protein
MSELPGRDDFASHLNTKFRVFFDGEQATEVDLIEVTKLRQKPRYEAFAVIFLAPNSTPPLQKLCKVEHDALGTMELFLVSVAQSEKGLSFEAVFNHQITPVDDDL